MTKVYHAAQLSLFTFSKVCSRCNPPTEKPIEAFAINAGCVDGHASYCKECDNRRHKTRALAKQKITVPSKVCLKCDPPTEKPINQFDLHYATKDGHRPWCKACVSAYNLAYRIEHHEEKKADDLAYYYANRESILDRRLTQYANNTEEVRRNNEEWAKANPLKMREYKKRHKVRKMQAAAGIVDYKRILERDSMWCYICQKDILSEQEIEFDHIIPLSRGGAHSEINIKVTHALCNDRKNARLLEEMTAFQRRGIA